jgi:2-dehydro-3-deoxyphosphogluconate aldolase / (4S)-4-hydroxy-2-oxoglutarate aldolase
MLVFKITIAMNVLQQILEHKIVAIIRGARPTDVLKIASALNEGGVRLLEVTLNSPGALKSIEQLSGEMDGKMVIGAGTVLDAASAKEAIAAGARFVISPVLDEEVIRTTRRYGAVSIPGAYTPTEVLKAYVLGGDIIKVFPSAGAGYLKDLLAPLPQLPLMPTGGINHQNITAFREAGAVAFGIGSALVDAKQPLTEGTLRDLKTKAQQLVEALKK